MDASGLDEAEVAGVALLDYVCRGSTHDAEP